MDWYIFDFMHNTWLSDDTETGEWSQDAIRAVAFKTESEAIEISNRLGGTVLKVIA